MTGAVVCYNRLDYSSSYFSATRQSVCHVSASTLHSGEQVDQLIFEERAGCIVAAVGSFECVPVSEMAVVFRL